MAQTVCMTGSVRGVHGSFIAFEDVDSLNKAFDDLQSAIVMLDMAYKEVDMEGWLVCPSPLHHGIDVSWSILRQKLEDVELYIRKLDPPIGRIIEQEDSWRPDGQEDVTD